jgi:hypothetical protein
MTKFGNIFINHLPGDLQFGTIILDIVFLKIGEIVKVGLCHAESGSHSRIIEQLLRSEKIFNIQKQAGKYGKDIPKAVFFDETSRRHGKIMACGKAEVDYDNKHIKFYGACPEYGIDIKLMYARDFMSNYYSDSAFTYEVEEKKLGA